MKRSLVLRREALSPLGTADLAGVAGGQYSGEGRLSCAATDCVALVTTDQVLFLVSQQISCASCRTFLVTGC